MNAKRIAKMQKYLAAMGAKPVPPTAEQQEQSGALGNPTYYDCGCAIPSHGTMKPRVCAKHHASLVPEG